MFQYFGTLEYTEKVLDKMLLKANKSIGILRILDKETEENYVAMHRENNPNYDEKYRETPHLFISKNFFKNYAEKNDLDYKFDKCNIKNFWNDPFIFDCFLYKKAR